MSARQLTAKEKEVAREILFALGHKDLTETRTRVVGNGGAMIASTPLGVDAQGLPFRMMIWATGRRPLDGCPAVQIEAWNPRATSVAAAFANTAAIRAARDISRRCCYHVTVFLYGRAWWYIGGRRLAPPAYA